jgi:large subunit ribosomal protein L6
MTEKLPRGIEVSVTENVINVTTKGKSKSDTSNHGTIRALINNDVKGVTVGWSRQLELVGTGFRAEVQGKTLVLTVGFSHTVKIEAPEGVTFKVEKLLITVEGYDREVVGQVAANIRGVRPPEPYKGKGIKYTDEVIRRKAGKAAAKTTGAA